MGSAKVVGRVIIGKIIGYHLQQTMPGQDLPHDEIKDCG
jgi:hypothetical protein